MSSRYRVGTAIADADPGRPVAGALVRAAAEAEVRDLGPGEIELFRPLENLGVPVAAASTCDAAVVLATRGQPLSSAAKRSAA